MRFGDLAGLPPARARGAVADRVMAAIADLSGQPYVHVYAARHMTRLAGGAPPATPS
jgi:hypothetical protein